MEPILSVKIFEFYKYLTDLLTIVENDDFYFYWNSESEKESDIYNLFIVHNDETIFPLSIELKGIEQLSNDKKLDYLKQTYIDYYQLYETFCYYTLKYPYIIKLFNCFQELEKNNIFKIDGEFYEEILNNVYSYATKEKEINKKHCLFNGDKQHLS